MARKRPPGKPPEPSQRKVTVRLPEDLARRLGVYCAARGVTVQDTLTRAVEDLVRGLRMPFAPVAQPPETASPAEPDVAGSRGAA